MARDHHRDPTGVWLVPAKKGTTEPTSLMYDQALDEALCIQRRLVALRTLEFLTFWTYLANRGVWEALVGAGPTCTVPATDEDRLCCVGCGAVTAVRLRA